MHTRCDPRRFPKWLGREWEDYEYEYDYDYEHIGTRGDPSYSYPPAASGCTDDPRRFPFCVQSVACPQRGS